MAAPVFVVAAEAVVVSSRLVSLLLLVVVLVRWSDSGGRGGSGTNGSTAVATHTSNSMKKVATDRGADATRVWFTGQHTWLAVSHAVALLWDASRAFACPRIPSYKS